MSIVRKERKGSKEERIQNTAYTVDIKSLHILGQIAGFCEIATNKIQVKKK